MTASASPAHRGRCTGRIPDTYSLRLLRAQERERKWLAEQIQEDPLQMLSHIARLLVSAAEAETSGADLKDVVLEAARLATTASDHLRSLAHELRPSVLDDFGLPQALRALAADFTLRTGTIVRFTIHGQELRSGQDAEVTCYRIAQEALRNIERHARAARVELRLSILPQQLRLLVADDGIGLEGGPTGSQVDGFGILDMAQRALALGGSLTIRSVKPAGTVLRLCVPLAPRPAA